MFLERWGRAAFGSIQHGKLEMMRAACCDSGCKRNRPSGWFSYSSCTRMWLEMGRDQERPLMARISVALGKKQN